MRIRWTGNASTGTPSYAELHLDKEIPSVIDAGRSETWLKKGGEPSAADKAFLRRIAKVDGVEKLHTEVFTLKIWIGRVFYWHTVIPEIHRILKERYNEDLELCFGEVDDTNRDLEGMLRKLQDELELQPQPSRRRA